MGDWDSFRVFGVKKLCEMESMHVPVLYRGDLSRKKEDCCSLAKKKK